jgi:Cu/Ag efflux pump CusA
MLIGLKPRASREQDVFQVIAGLRSRLAREVPQAQVEFIQVMQDTIADLAGNPTPIEVKILGGEYPALQSAADGVEKGMAAVADTMSSPALTARSASSSPAKGTPK